MPDLQAVYSELRSVLAVSGSRLVVKRDDGDEYYVESAQSAQSAGSGKPAFFGAVQVRARFVSYHLMPVYTNPEPLDGLSPGLQARMQGKSCFNLRRWTVPCSKSLPNSGAAATRCSSNRAMPSPVRPWYLSMSDPESRRGSSHAPGPA